MAGRNRATRSCVTSHLGVRVIAYEVHLNGQRLCIAGADDLGVLTAILTIGGKLGSRSVRPPRTQSAEDTGEERPRPTLHVSGLTSRSVEGTDEHLRWQPGVVLAIGDVVELRILEVAPDAADPAEAEIRSRKPPDRRTYERVKQEYLRLREKFEPDGPPSV